MTDVYVLDTTFLREFMKALRNLRSIGGDRMADELTLRLKSKGLIIPREVIREMHGEWRVWVEEHLGAYIKPINSEQVKIYREKIAPIIIHRWRDHVFKELREPVWADPWVIAAALEKAASMFGGASIVSDDGLLKQMTRAIDPNLRVLKSEEFLDLLTSNPLQNP